MSRLASFRRLCGNAPLIAPSMLKCDFGNLQRDVSLLESGDADVLHLDVMDGHFVPNLSYGPMVIQRMRELTDRPFDAHLMISDPARYLDDYLNAGCDWVTFHVEAVPEPIPLLRRIRDRGAIAGIALNPGTPAAAVLPVLNECDLVLVMSVEPGFGGQSFMPRVLDKVRRIAERRDPGTERSEVGGRRSEVGGRRSEVTTTHHSPLTTHQTQLSTLDSRLSTLGCPLISIDGGIGPETIAAAAEAGADVFVVGSAIFDTADYSAAITDLRQRARAHRADAILNV